MNFWVCIARGIYGVLHMLHYEIYSLQCIFVNFNHLTQVKNHLWVFINCLIENPTFDSQTKENMTLQAKSFGSKCPLSEKFVTQVCVISQTHMDMNEHVATRISAEDINVKVQFFV